MAFHNTLTESKADYFSALTAKKHLRQRLGESLPSLVLLMYHGEVQPQKAAQYLQCLADKPTPAMVSWGTLSTTQLESIFINAGADAIETKRAITVLGNKRVLA